MDAFADVALSLSLVEVAVLSGFEEDKEVDVVWRVFLRGDVIVLLVLLLALAVFDAFEDNGWPSWPPSSSSGEVVGQQR